MADNPDLRVFVGSGLYDVATTFFAAEYNVRRSTMDRSRVVLRNYPAGHMMYVHHPSLRELARDMREFIQPSARTRGTATSAGSGR
jgi:carboxypeptidase C (cathepsin A)